MSVKPVSPVGTGTTRPLTLIGVLPVKDQLTEASVRFPSEPLASALPPVRTFNVPPLFAQVPEKPVKPTIFACGHATAIGEETKTLALVPFAFALCSANR